MNVGGGFQGNDGNISNAETVTVESGARLSADSISDGDAGTVVVWSDQDTLFSGEISARGAGSGKGGFVEVFGQGKIGL